MNKIISTFISVATIFVCASTNYANEVDSLSTEKNEIQIQEEERKRAREEEDKKLSDMQRQSNLTLTTWMHITILVLSMTNAGDLTMQ